MGGGRRLQDGLEARLGEHGDAAGVCADALGAHLDLGRRLLAADEQHLAARRGDAVERLQQQRALADAGLAPDQHERARDHAAAEHEVELGDAGREACRGRRDDVGQADGRGGGVAVAAAALRRPPRGVAAATMRSSVNEFQAPQSGQWPSHLGSRWPHWPQVKTVCVLLMS